MKERTSSATVPVTKTGSGRCPACNSPDPKLHPSVQYEGEVRICSNAFHSCICPFGVIIGDCPEHGYLTDGAQ